MLKLSGKRPSDIGPSNGKLAKCSWKPNCVCSSHEDDTDHFIAPLDFGKPVEQVWSDLVSVIKAESAATIIKEDSFYLHAEFSTSLMGFVDDVEFLGQAGQSTIHVRSASRLGIRDFGVNRKRVEELRSELSNPR